MKPKFRRMHLFEVEDLSFCPKWIRDMMTSMLIVIHRWFGTARVLATEIRDLISRCGDGRAVALIDLCSGAGGPMPQVSRQLRSASETTPSLRLFLTDLHPPLAAPFIPTDDTSTVYVQHPVDASNVCPKEILEASGNRAPEKTLIIRTMVCSFHHMHPELAIEIMKDAQQQQQPLVVLELTDGTMPPTWLWWISLVPNFFFGLVVSLYSRPMTAGRILFSFLLPVIPICFAWDGAVSAARTYSQQDFDQLIELLPKTDDYQWHYKTVKGGPVRFSMIVGEPVPH